MFDMQDSIVRIFSFFIFIFFMSSDGQSSLPKMLQAEIKKWQNLTMFSSQIVSKLIIKWNLQVIHFVIIMFSIKLRAFRRHSRYDYKKKQIKIQLNKGSSQQTISSTSKVITEIMSKIQEDGRTVCIETQVPHLLLVVTFSLSKIFNTV